MRCRLEYHKFVNRAPIPASLALCGIFLLPLLLSVSSAQVNNSLAGSVRPIRVAPPTATRVAPPTALTVPPPTGTSFGLAHSTHRPFPPRSPHDNDNGQHPRHANGTAYYPYVYPVPVPYAVDLSDAQNPEDQDAQNGGPDSADDPGSSGPSSTSRIRAQTEDPAADAGADSAVEPPQAPTTLVFKDGHQLAVNNYAIVNQTLYDLTPGHARKIALADLDLPATEKQNDDRGVVFELPPTTQAN